jgi:DNA modification methylase
VYHTSLGSVVLADCLAYLKASVADASVDLIVTSPPFGLVRKKEYGNVDAGEYVAWFKPFGAEFKRVLKPTGSLVIDIGGAWISGQPTRSLYHYELVIMLCQEVGFHLAQEFFWWNPSKLPTPAGWVTIRRVRVKDAVNCLWWLSPTPWPRASNTRVLQPYSESMRSLLKNRYHAKLRPSGHDISKQFQKDNTAAIPPNLIALAHTESNSAYLRYCAKLGLKPHPARFPEDLPEYFIRMLTDRGDYVIDPFAGSCATGAVAERLGRRWLCLDISDAYLQGAMGRFMSRKMGGKTEPNELFPGASGAQSAATYYRIPRPGVLWNGSDGAPLAADGGQKRRKRSET